MKAKDLTNGSLLSLLPMRKLLDLFGIGFVICKMGYILAYMNGALWNFAACSLNCCKAVAQAILRCFHLKQNIQIEIAYAINYLI